MDDRMASVVPGLLVALLTLVGGVVLAVILGVYSVEIKATFLQHAMALRPRYADANLARTVTQVEAAHTAAEAWKYLKRAHVHAEGLGTAALTAVFLLGQTSFASVLKQVCALAISVGGFLYPFCLGYTGITMVSQGKAAAMADVHLLVVVSVLSFVGGLGTMMARIGGDELRRKRGIEG